VLAGVGLPEKVRAEGLGMEEFLAIRQAVKDRITP
jgi:hypothetical protein